MVLFLCHFEGDGSEENPYQIYTRQDLEKLDEIVNTGNTEFNNKSYILMNDIDLGEAE